MPIVPKTAVSRVELPLTLRVVLAFFIRYYLDGDPGIAAAGAGESWLRVVLSWFAGLGLCSFSFFSGEIFLKLFTFGAPTPLLPFNSYFYFSFTSF